MSSQVFECIFSGHLAGQFVQNILHVDYDNATSLDSFSAANDIASGLNTAGQAVDGWCGMLPQDYTLTSLRVRKLLGGGGATAIISGGLLSSNQGARTGDISSAQVAPLIIWVGTTTPDKTGRTFLPGVSEDDIDEMALVTGLQTEMNGFAVLWASGASGGTAGQQYKGAIFRRVAGLWDLIAAGYPSPHIGTQRRRLLPM